MVGSPGCSHPRLEGKGLLLCSVVVVGGSQFLVGWGIESLLRGRSQRQLQQSRQEEPESTPCKSPLVTCLWRPPPLLCLLTEVTRSAHPHVGDSTGWAWSPSTLPATTLLWPELQISPLKPVGVLISLGEISLVYTLPKGRKGSGEAGTSQEPTLCTHPHQWEPSGERPRPPACQGLPGRGQWAPGETWSPCGSSLWGHRVPR